MSPDGDQKEIHMPETNNAGDSPKEASTTPSSQARVANKPATDWAQIINYDPELPSLFGCEARRIRDVLGD
jgi:hypothetical protein